MKIKKHHLQSGFQPFAISITIESQEDRDALLDMTLYNKSIPKLLEEENKLIVESFLNKKDIDQEINTLLDQATVVNIQAQAYLSEGDLDNAMLFCGIAEELVEEAGELRKLKDILFVFSSLPVQEYHFIQGNNKVEEMVAVIDLN